MPDSGSIMIGCANLLMEEVGTPAIPENEAAWNAMTEIGYVDPEAGVVFKPGLEIHETKVARYPAPVMAALIGGGCTLEIVLMESAIEKLAWVLGGKASDIVDNQTDHIKTFYAPVGLGAAQEFNVQLEQCFERF